ncbi:Stk1 family PASTA domain-containing Ser/Thr kinase [Desemzia sp. RIT804]|uniref:Stk1 family PASTA domain-containing Ser/Thr kinase n=1 Tax=Desemzia sp. RIT 804 TaxID=2810209 RepID=UPI00194EC1C6|nr:Stk1 family PASTA domain-containing Ser/Thr kinase [Desemzia sp. RIT 804]MBM6613662.1 Stk1 family PASTA domain-containing Ser/Thr kinase [Desemzia sp. RIT 804]
MENGKKLNGRYKILKPVGSGGMANVYLAHDLILDRDVAVKVLRYDFRKDQDTIRRFKREALSSTELVHPNIVSIYDVGEENDTQYIVMEYIKGMDLKEYINNNFPIAYRKVLNIMSQILSAVSYAHQNQIIHRDLKPQNVLIDESGVVKITDFGIAVAVSQSSITQTNSLLGSVHYLSPEQARGAMATNQSDIYSLGIILYELLTGSVPFEGESAVSIALKHFQESIPSVKKFDSRIPQALENVVLKATAKETADRYKSVHEMEIDLETALSPSRVDELPYAPVSMLQETKVITPISVTKESDLEDTMVIPVLKEEPKEESAPEKKKKKKKRKWIWVVLLSIFFVAIGVALAAYLLTPRDVTIPNLEEMTLEEAETELSKVNLSVDEVFEEPNEEIEEGLVIRSNPNIGNSVKENTQVDLFISSGKATFEFMDYTNKDYQEIRAELTELGFTVESVQENSEVVPEGDIIAQDIDEDEEVIPSETTVTFTVSSGRAGTEMRDLNGYSQKSVEDFASENGLKLQITEEYSEETPIGYVISQDIDPGTIVYNGDELNIVVSLGKEDIPERQFTIPVTIPYQNTAETSSESESSTESESSETETEESSSESQLVPNTIEIYIEDAEHSLNTLFQQFTITEDYDLEIPFVLEEGATGSYRIVRDGETIEEITNVTAPDVDVNE